MGNLYRVKNNVRGAEILRDALKNRLFFYA